LIQRLVGMAADAVARGKLFQPDILELRGSGGKLSKSFTDTIPNSPFGRALGHIFIPELKQRAAINLVNVMMALNDDGALIPVGVLTAEDSSSGSPSEPTTVRKFLPVAVHGDVLWPCSATLPPGLSSTGLLPKQTISVRR